jgi:hypothetical protein
MQLDRALDLDEAAIDAAPFQLVLGTSLYKVHTLFSLLALSHAYVTDRGQLVGVVALREVRHSPSLGHSSSLFKWSIEAVFQLRDALSNIYSRGAVPATVFRRPSKPVPGEAESGSGDRDDLDSGFSERRLPLIVSQ